MVSTRVSDGSDFRDATSNAGDAAVNAETIGNMPAGTRFITSYYEKARRSLSESLWGSVGQCGAADLVARQGANAKLMFAAA